MIALLALVLMSTPQSDYWLVRGGGWDLDRYRRDFPWDPSRAITSQSGKKEMEPLRADSRREWESQRRKLRRTLDSILGSMPGRTAPLNPRILEEVDKGAYLQLKVI